ncbi:guanitoxin biosynthesis heme-dependent pre-guanitoxin N-hydroxylase GntA [Nonomuraea helvata]|uniref:Guanitoxin biosynthesis heme-dependent pre-guanitoxin N-hydroxylase GntA n=1 Tax=Nonomuraea helvata TaxID=37484 RepID=A0ABV5S507_9ACTN
MDDDVYAALAAFIEQDDFVCLGARAALHRKSIVHHHYPELGELESVRAHHRDVLDFLESFEPSARSFTSFVATFEEPGELTEDEYETLLWRHLQAMHDLDSERFPWNDQYSSDPESADFAYSVGAHPFFVVGLHSGASRPSRRFGRPTLVFNSHIQFNALGIKFFKLRTKIRGRERSFHGSPNPSFIAYKDEARHYGGRFTEPTWRCPFTPKTD